MATVNNFLKRVLVSITVLRVGEAGSNAQLSNALDGLNEMLGNWYLEGIPINDGDLALTDTFPIDGTEKLAVRENLAVMLAKEYNRPIHPTRITDAYQYYLNLLNRYHPDYSLEHDTALSNIGGRQYDINSDE